MNKMRVLFLFLISTSFLHSQVVDSFEIKFQDRYAKNIVLEEIEGIYIPIDVQDAMLELDRMSSPEAKAKLLEGEESIIIERLDKGLGKWMALKWSFYEGSRLSHHLKSLGVSYTDDMTKFLIASYYRHLKGEDLAIKERAAEIKKQRDEEYAEKLKKRKVTVMKKQ